MLEQSTRDWTAYEYEVDLSTDRIALVELSAAESKYQEVDHIRLIDDIQTSNLELSIY